MQNLTLSITQLNTYIKQIIDAEEFIQNIGVYGEITNYKVSNGNAYFDIKEEGAQLSCIKFGANFSDFKNGDKVLVTGRLNYHVKLGRLTFVASKIEAYGMGELYQKYLELKKKLQVEGLFDEEFKKPIPKYARNVGVVTSETGAVIRDILHVRNKKNPHTNVYVYPTKVQGVGAEDEIAAGIEFFSTEFPVDVIIVARGGGSFEDLSPFNTEKVARAAFACSLPIISAVGHETDFSLIDFAADFRAPTPSVAGEVAFFDYMEEISRIKNNIESAKYFMEKKLEISKSTLQLETNTIISNIQNRFNVSKQKVLLLSQTSVNKIDNIILQCKNNLDKLVRVLESNNPLEILKKGYMRADKNGNIISSVRDVEIGDEINLRVSDGKLLANIISKGEDKWNTKKL